MQTYSCHRPVEPAQSSGDSENLLPINDIIDRPGQQSLRLLTPAMNQQVSPVSDLILADRRVAFKPSRRPAQNKRRTGRRLENRDGAAQSLHHAGRYTMQDSAIVKRSVRIAGHPTSISLEAAFWRGLHDIAVSRQVSI